jgi:hypothetical protein
MAIRKLIPESPMAKTKAKVEGLALCKQYQQEQEQQQKQPPQKPLKRRVTSAFTYSDSFRDMNPCRRRP